MLKRCHHEQFTGFCQIYFANSIHEAKEWLGRIPAEQDRKTHHKTKTENEKRGKGVNSRENAKMKPKGNVEKGEKHYRGRKEVK